jgi:hypothetical protein
LEYERLFLEEIDDVLDLTAHAERYRIDYNTVRSHQAPSWNRPRVVHVGLSRRPAWSENERDVVALFAHPQIGELSATWNAPLGVWLLLYNAGSPRGINALVEQHPWGPWSQSVVLFDPDWAGIGYGEFMHVRDAPDGLSDPGREDEWGGEYGPYVISGGSSPRPSLS